MQNIFSALQKKASHLSIGNEILRTFVLAKKKIISMATITLDYDARNVQAKKALDFILSLGLFQKKEKTQRLSRFEQSMLDIEQGNVFYINGPKK